MTVQTITELDNKAIQGRLPILDWHGPFLGGLLYREKRHFGRRLIGREQLPLLGRFAQHAVQ
ncbi:hypothetical protein D3C80_1626000 [compost metagenome]